MINIRDMLPIIAVLLFIFGAGCLQTKESPVVSEPTQSTGHGAMLQLLDTVTIKIEESLLDIRKATSDAAIALGTTGISGPEAASEQRKVMTTHPAILTVITYDVNGTVLSAEPDDAKVLLGQSINDQETVQQALTTKEPFMSDLFTLAQGGEAVVIVYPVFSTAGKFTGVISTAFSPCELIAPIAGDAAHGTPYTFMVAQPHGRILYDPDPEEVGKETFNETLYAEFPEIVDLARQYSGNRSGYDTYSFYSTGSSEVVRKETFWSTVGLFGAEWRVFVIGEV